MQRRDSHSGMDNTTYKRLLGVLFACYVLIMRIFARALSADNNISANLSDLQSSTAALRSALTSTDVLTPIVVPEAPAANHISLPVPLEHIPLAVTSQAFLYGARSGNRKLIEEYIAKHVGESGFSVLGREAARIAENYHRDDIAGMILQLLGDADTHEQHHTDSRVPEENAGVDISYRAQLEGMGVSSEMIPADFKDPVTLEIMEDPVALASGRIVDRSTLISLINRGDLRDPVNRMEIREADRDNITLQFMKSKIEEFIAEKKAEYELANRRSYSLN